MNEMPVVLSVAGSDNSAGAGIQADLKTMAACGVYGVTAVTCVVAEVPGKVSAIHPVPAAIVKEQTDLLLAAFPIGAVKTGMLFSQEIMEAVFESFRTGGGGDLTQCPPRTPLVVDPVMVATAGTRLLKNDALETYKRLFFPTATLVTPNLDETEVLIGGKVGSRSGMEAAGRALSAEFGTAFLIKGGHLRDGNASDYLALPDGHGDWFEAPYIPGVSTHGTGCAYSAAIASGLGKGLSLADAVEAGKRFVSGAISGFHRWKTGSGHVDALNHFVRLDGSTTAPSKTP